MRESQLNPNFDVRRECEHMPYDVRVFIFVGKYYNVSYTPDIKIFLAIPSRFF